MFSIAQASSYVNCYNVAMEITELERAQVIIDTLKARVHVLEEGLLAEQVAHALTRLSYQKAEQAATVIAEMENG